jgi:hypothetical protein
MAIRDIAPVIASSAFGNGLQQNIQQQALG